jgi:hypothetical protein
MKGTLGHMTEHTWTADRIPDLTGVMLRPKPAIPLAA